MNRTPTLAIGALLLAATAATCGAATVTVQSNNPAGDAFTNPTSVNAGQLVGASGWYYNSVRNDGTVGINTTYARNGNGSVYFNGTQGPGGASSKGDIEFGGTSDVVINTLNLSPLGSLANLTSLSYDWYRDSVSTNTPNQHPSLRLYVQSADKTQSGYLVFEEVYNGLVGNVATNSWVTDVITGNTNLWGTGNLPNNFNAPNSDTFTTTLAEWQASAKNYQVYGISSGFGSGWGPFTGAVDNITIGFGTAPATTYNFETAAVTGGAAVPLPAAAWSGLATLAGLAGTVVIRRRRAVA